MSNKFVLVEWNHKLPLPGNNHDIKKFLKAGFKFQRRKGPTEREINLPPTFTVQQYNNSDIDEYFEGRKYVITKGKKYFATGFYQKNLYGWFRFMVCLVLIFRNSKRSWVLVMFINTGYQITNTPNHFTAAYNTWPYTAPRSQWYQHVPRYYIDHNGHRREWDAWNPPQLMHIPGGQYKGTPTRTGAFYSQNVIVDPRQIQDRSGGCGCHR